MITHSINSTIQLWLLQRKCAEVLFLPELGYLSIEREVAHVIQGQGIVPTLHSLNIANTTSSQKQIVSIIDLIANISNINVNYANDLYENWINSGYHDENNSFIIAIDNVCRLCIDSSNQIYILDTDHNFDMMLNPISHVVPIELICSANNTSKNSDSTKKKQRHRSSKNSNINFYLWLSVILGILACLVIIYSYLPPHYADIVNQALGITKPQ